jgi:hypothetical protein
MLMTTSGDIALMRGVGFRGIVDMRTSNTLGGQKLSNRMQRLDALADDLETRQ